MNLAVRICMLLTLGCPFMASGQDQESRTLFGAARTDALRLSESSLATVLGRVEWKETSAERRHKWREMLGIDPLPNRTPLHATVTGTLDRGDYVVEKIHFQSVPGAYVIGNLYRPARIDGPLPAVLYLCGHSQGKVNPRYQANTRWFAQHGYVALVLDPIQLGESKGFHHGTYHADRWDWPSRGYTPAGTEVWNAMRALDYLETRDDVDSQRMGVTGLSGGGVISWCLGAADERVKVVVPVCQSGSIAQVVTDRGTDGHCDCAFWINYYRWCWPDIGSLIAPRALLIASGTEDVLWRPNGYRVTAGKIRDQYYQLGANENFDLVEDASPHGYTPKLRLAIFTWFNKHLRDDPTPVTEDITDFVEPEQNLLVFGDKRPEDKMAQIDRLLVRQAEIPEFTDKESWIEYQATALSRLRATTFRNTLSDVEPELRAYRADGSDQGDSSFGTYEFLNDEGILVGIKTTGRRNATGPVPTLVFALQQDARQSFTGGGSSRPRVSGAVATAAVEVRNTAATSIGPGYLWTARRTYPLLGKTLPERQVSDLLSAVSILRAAGTTESVSLYGQGYTAPLAIYAGLLDPDVSEIVIADCPASHKDPTTPEFLGILRVGDLPQTLALAYPRPITFVGKIPAGFEWTKDVYERFGAGRKIRVIQTIRDWQPR